MKIEIPTKCPTCGHSLELVNSQLFCRNGSCGAKTSKRLEHYAKVLKIKGLGPVAVTKLQDEFDIEFPWELYEITQEGFVKIFGQKIGIKLYKEIDKTRTSDFPTFLSALSIPLIGKTASTKIAEYCNSLIELKNLKIEDIVGPKAASNIKSWLDTEEYSCYDEISFTEKRQKKESLGKVCITGKLKDFSNRDAAAKFLESLGYTIVTTVSKNTTYLVDEEGKQSSKKKKAEQLNIPIVTIKHFEEKI